MAKIKDIVAVIQHEGNHITNKLLEELPNED